MREAIKRNQTQSDAFRRNHRRTGAPDEASNQRSFRSSHAHHVHHHPEHQLRGALKCNQVQSSAIKCNQAYRNPEHQLRSTQRKVTPARDPLREVKRDCFTPCLALAAVDEHAGLGEAGAHLMRDPIRGHSSAIKCTINCNQRSPAGGPSLGHHVPSGSQSHMQLT